MTTSLEERLRRHYLDRTGHLPTVGPGINSRVGHDVELSPFTPQRSRPRARGVLIAAAATVVVVAGLVTINQRNQDDTTGATSNTDAPATAADSALEPAATLPDMDDLDTTPVTVAGSEPTTWFRVAPDLDVAWYAPPDGSAPSMFCWRTATDQDCQPDDLPSLIVATTAGNQTLVIASGAGSQEVQVQLDDGSGLSAPVITTQSAIDLGVARFELPDGRSIVSTQLAALGSDLSGDPEPIEVTGATLPPAGDLIEVPLTVPADSPLAYWRFLPDLDIAERQTATASGTEFCWRTPAGTGCLDNTFHSPDVGVIPTDHAAILLARPALIPIEPAPTDPMAPTLRIGPTPTIVTVALSDGTTQDVTLTIGEQYGISYARIDLPAGTTITSATSS
jgi:hypothetical protein